MKTSPDAVRKALALLAYSIAASGDAKRLLLALSANCAAAMQEPTASEQLDEILASMLQAVSSAAVKQRPEDQDVQAIYRGLRPGARH